MDIKYEYLELIPKLLEEIKNLKQKEQIEKRWLNVAELANYIGYSKDRIHALTNDEFIEGRHFYKKGKLLFDRAEIDNWVKGISTKINPKEIVTQVLKDIL
jgi:predicted DNA-binding transcriptional regulator AlpA